MRILSNGPGLCQAAKDRYVMQNDSDRIKDLRHDVLEIIRNKLVFAQTVSQLVDDPEVNHEVNLEELRKLACHIDDCITGVEAKFDNALEQLKREAANPETAVDLP